jgi:hypothetical protein
LSGTYTDGTVVTLTAVPDNGYQVMAWTGTDDNSRTSNTNTVTMNADRTVTVRFEPVISCLTIGGAVYEDPDNPSDSGKADVTVTAAGIKGTHGTWSATTDIQGSWSLCLPQGSYQVGAEAPGYQVECIIPQAALPIEITVDASHQAENQNLQFLATPTPHWLRIQQCQVRAGKTAGTDQVQITGSINADPADFLAAENIQITMDGEYILQPLVLTFPINEITFKAAKSNYAGSDQTSMGTFKYGLRNGQFTFRAVNVDLTGLNCPLSLEIRIGDFAATAQADEDLVNGTRLPCPPELMMGILNTLQITRQSVRFSGKPNSDSILASGSFTIEGVAYDKNNPLVIVVGTQTFTVPGQKFIPKGSVEICSNAQSSEGPLVLARFDFSRCTYLVRIRNAAITDSGVVPFGLSLFGIDLLGLETIDLGSR